MKAELGVYPKDRQQLYEILPLDTPLIIDIRITHLCNFHCNYCVLSVSEEEFSKTGFKNDSMSWETFNTVVKQLNEFPNKIKMITLSGIGEATLDKRLPEMVKMLNESNTVDLTQVITNASKLTSSLSNALIDAGLGELRVSLQGLSEEKYWEISRVKINWDDLYNNIKYFSSIRGDCKLKIKIANTALDPGEENKFYELFGDICDAIGIENIFDAWGMLVNMDLAKYEKTRFGFKQKNVNVCRRPFTSLAIQPDGLCTTYCNVKFNFCKNIHDYSIFQIWNSQEMNDFRKSMLKELRQSNNYCKKCSVPNESYHPKDVLDGHENEILARMP